MRIGRSQIARMQSAKDRKDRGRINKSKIKKEFSGRTFDPGENEIFWCEACNVPLLSKSCSICGSLGRSIRLSPPSDVRLCSSSGRDLLKYLFTKYYGWAEFLDSRIILLNKIAGIDRRDQVFLDGHHIATLWFDITTGSYRLDLELAGAALIADNATKNVVICNEALLKSHIKGKWIDNENIEQGPDDELVTGDCVVLRIGKYIGVGAIRKGKDGSFSIRAKELTKDQFRLADHIPDFEEVLIANEAHLKLLEKKATSELKEALSRFKLPVNISFSGGKDSLASLWLALKVQPKADVLFIDTKLEFPETVEYVHNFAKAHNLKLHVVEGTNRFFEDFQNFGPPAKDFRWCCKTNKLGPLTTFIEEHYPKGCVTIEGRRIYESFSRSKIGPVEKNPYVPGQITLCPIRDWKALEVMLYIRWKRLQPNPLYEKDYERIGCWLCPAALQSEFSNTKRTHPQLYEKWTSLLKDWSDGRQLDPRYVNWGFWRWKSHPPKIVEIAKANEIGLKIAPGKEMSISLDLTKGRSPCGVSYSIEANLAIPQNHPFSAVANVLTMLGDVKYSENLGTAILEAKEGKCTVFANGHLLVVAPKEKADNLLGKAVEAIFRTQMCTRCKICMKSCKRGAITVGETISVDERRCNRCGRCSQGCIAAAEAKKLCDNSLMKASMSNSQRA